MPFVEDVPQLQAQAPGRIVRETDLVTRVACVGGQGGCGKTLVTPIIGSFAKVEIQKYQYTLEHLCWLALMGRLEPDVATAMIRMQADTDLYHLSMSREANFRPLDLSSVFKNPGAWRYLRRLFQPGDAEAIARIRRERPILHYLTHHVLAIAEPLFSAFGDRLRVVEIVRHPLYMIKQLYLYYAERHAQTLVRDLTIWYTYRGHVLPCFAYGWEELYLRSNIMDRAIYRIEQIAKLGQQAVHRLPESLRARIMILPFERFVLDPWPFLRQLERLLGSSVTRLTVRELKRQRVPRRMFAEGIGEPIYKEYGWQPPEPGADERRELETRRRFAAQHASAEGLRALDRLCAEYEATHLQGLLPAQADRSA